MAINIQTECNSTSDGTFNTWGLSPDARLVMTTTSVGMKDNGDLQSQLSVSNTYNANGWLTQNVGVQNGNTQTVTYSNFLSNGSPQVQTVLHSDGNSDHNVTDNLSLGYYYFDQPMLTQISGSRTDSAGTSSVVTNYLVRDVNGQLNAEIRPVASGALVDNSSDGVFTIFRTTSTGQVLARYSVGSNIGFGQNSQLPFRFQFNNLQPSVDSSNQILFYAPDGSTPGGTFLASYGVSLNNDNSSSLVLAREREANFSCE